MSTAPQYANPAIVESQQQSVADAIEHVRDQLDETPQHPNALSGVVQWIIDIATSIIALIELLAASYARRIMDLESFARDAPPPSSTKTTAPSSTPSAPTTSRLKRCAKCHARGHDDSVCRTADPTAMRKRIAANSRRAREARTALPTYPAYPLPNHPLLPQPTFPLPPQASYSALVADATELRRRNAQSSRDRRRRRAPTNVNTS